MKFELSRRLQELSPYLFAEIDRQKNLLKKKNIEYIDLSIGDPDIPAPRNIINILSKAAALKENQKYALDQGKFKLRKSIKAWLIRRFNINADADKEILPLIGSKEGLVHFPLGFVSRGDYIIIPSPAYPAYRGAAVFAGARIYELPLLEKNNFLPELSKIPLYIRNKAKIIYLNYPNNPTTALAPLVFLKELVKFCAHYGIILAYDNAYSEIYFEQKPHSILEVKGAKEIAVEFHSFSKTFCMTGFRIGWAVGNRDLIKGLLKVKTNIDSGIFGAVQEAAKSALDKEKKYVDNLREVFRKRRETFIRGIKDRGFSDIYSQATFYVWTKIPRQFNSSLEFARHLIEKKKIVATPGVGFGRQGEGFIRFALTVDKDTLHKAAQLLEN